MAKVQGSKGGVVSKDKYSKERMIALIKTLKFLVATAWEMEPDWKDRTRYEVDGELFEEVREFVGQYKEENGGLK